MILYATLLLVLMVSVRYLYPLPWKPFVKTLLGLVFLLASQHRLISEYVFGSKFSPEVPALVIMGVNVVFGTLLFLVLMQLLLDFGLLVALAFRRRLVPVPARVRYGMGLLALGASLLGVWQAVRVPPIKEITIGIRDLPPEFEGYRMIQLTDLHLSRLFEAPWMEEVVRLSNAQNVDLVVITGDMSDGTLAARWNDVAPLQKLTAKDGVYFIPGNHEYYFGYEGWMKRFEDLGLKRIENSHVLLKRGTAQLILAGVTDLSAPNTGHAPPDVEMSLAGAPTGVPIIMLDHKPFEARKAAEAGVDLQLSGHTHGGSIWGFHKLIAAFNNGFVSGLYQVGNMQLYVNNGTAIWLGFAIRLGQWSELTVITLKRNQEVGL